MVMDQQKVLPKSKGFMASMLAIALAATSVIASAQAAQAIESSSTVTINGLGGQDPNDNDGIGIVINGGEESNPAAPFDGSDEVYLGGLSNFFGQGGGLVLAIPTSNSTALVFGNAGAGVSGTEGGDQQMWDDIIVSNLDGSARNDGTVAAGAGSATVMYTARATINSVPYEYSIVRKITYTNGGLWNGQLESKNVYHNTFTLFATNNAPSARLFYGGDLAPGASDEGFGILQSPPVAGIAPINSTTVYALNPNIEPGMYLAIGEGNDGESGAYTNFDGYSSRNFEDPYDAINQGQDIGTNLDPNEHDAGIQVQFNLGTPNAPSSTISGQIDVVKHMDVSVGRYTSLKAKLQSDNLTSNRDTTLKLALETSEVIDTLDPGFSFSFNLPASLKKSSNFTSFGNDCFVAGTISWANNNRTIVGSGIKLKARGDAKDHCTITAAVTAGQSVGDFKLTTSDAITQFPLLNLLSYEYSVAKGTTVPVEPKIMLPSTAKEAEDLSLALNLAVGAKITGAKAKLSGKGLKANSTYQLIMESKPKVLATGTTNSAGKFSASVNLSAFCPGAGKHTLTLIGTKPNGQRTKAVTSLVLDKKCAALAIVQGKKSDKSVKVGGLRFAADSAALKPETIAALKLIAPVIKNAKIVTVEGYTSGKVKSKATRFVNKKLAGDRAKNVANYVASLGVKAKFVVVAKGAVNPISKNAKAKNRRVEISVSF
jgi:outer membrane protein OmpA-like peptidoglycan-associated protein